MTKLDETNKQIYEEVKKRRKEKKVKRIIFLSLIVITLLVTFLFYKGYVYWQNKLTEKDEYMLPTEEEVNSYTDEEFNDDTFNIDNYDELNESEQSKIDDINSMKLSTYMLNREKLRSDILLLLSMTDSDSVKKAMAELDCDSYFYEIYVADYYEQFGIGEVEELNIEYAGVTFSNSLSCDYYIIATALWADGDGYADLRIKMSYSNNVLTQFDCDKEM
jgi:hypothetical protein